MKRNEDQLNIFDLFNDESSIIDKTAPQKQTSLTHSSYPYYSSIQHIEREYGTAIEMYVKSAFTVNEICTQLIEEHNAPNERYVSGKPKIYPHIMMYLDTLVERGLCLAKQRDANEGIYVWEEKENTLQL